MTKEPSKLLLQNFIFFIFLLPSLLFTVTVAVKCNKQDYKALLKIKQDLGNPYHLASWIPNTDCCSWYVVDCDTNGRIVQFHLFQGEISAQIPASIGELSHLEQLTFRKLTNLTGEIPLAISKLKNLKFLWLSWTNLTGPVPAFLGELKNLWFLDLSFNDLTGSIPPSLGYLPNLRGINFGRNKLTGSIPESFGNLAGEDIYLRLSHNRLTGTVPKSLGVPKLTLVELSRNLLTGDASFLFGRNTTVQSIDLSRNLFDFDLSTVDFTDNLTALDLNHNGITGNLPARLTQLNFQYLNVSYNRLCGQIPAGGELQKFGVTEYFHNRCLCGAPLPACR